MWHAPIRPLWINSHTHNKRVQQIIIIFSIARSHTAVPYYPTPTLGCKACFDESSDKKKKIKNCANVKALHEGGNGINSFVLPSIGATNSGFHSLRNSTEAWGVSETFLIINWFNGMAFAPMKQKIYFIFNIFCALDIVIKSDYMVMFYDEHILLVWPSVRSDYVV